MFLFQIKRQREWIDEVQQKEKAPYDNPAPLVKIGYLLCQMAVEMQ
jgi:hypothetical protein